MTLTTLLKKYLSGQVKHYLAQTDCTPNDSHFVIWWKGKESGFVKVNNLN